MVKNIYSVFDVKAELYGTLFPMKSHGEALRGFQDLCEDRNTMPGRHPGDFKLVQLGTFDDVTGLISATVPPLSLSFGSDLVGQKNVTPIGVTHGA